MKKILVLSFILLYILIYSQEYKIYKEYDLSRTKDKNIKVEMFISDIIFDYSAKNKLQIKYVNTLKEFPNINFNRYINNTNISEDFIDSYKTFSLFKRLVLGENTYVKNWNGDGEYNFLVGYPINDLILINNRGLIELKNINILNSIRIINLIGNINLKNIASKDLYIENNMGKIDITNIFNENKITIINETGNIAISNHGNLINDLEINSKSSLMSLREIEANKIKINNGEGRIDLTIKNVKDLEIKMGKGNILLKLYGSNFNLDLETKNGSIRVFGKEKQNTYYNHDEFNTNNIKVKIETGNIYVYDMSYIN